MKASSNVLFVLKVVMGGAMETWNMKVVLPYLKSDIDLTQLCTQNVSIHPIHKLKQLFTLGKPTTLICDSEIAHPPVNSEWRQNNQIVQGTMPPDSAGMRKLDYEMTPVVGDAGSIFNCSDSSTYFNDLTDTKGSLPPIKVASIQIDGITHPDGVMAGVTPPDVTDPGVPAATWIATIAGLILTLVVGGSVMLFCLR